MYLFCHGTGLEILWWHKIFFKLLQTLHYGELKF